MVSRLPMTGWFDPGLLIQTGIRAAVSTVFGRFADRREAIAAANAISASPADATLDYSAHQGDFWFDYIADTGDGWNPTYAMARLVSQNSVAPEPGRQALPRGRLLLLGGDQVYPSASRDDYQRRFREPFEEAYKPAGTPLWDERGDDAPHLYALPGDHDWHDSLNAFFGLFCRRRVVQPGALGTNRDGAVIAGRQTRQTRSYFALKLPRGWWLWGSDSQMEGYIDQPQIDYFSHAARHWMAPKSKLILCVAEPVWENVNPKKIDERYQSFAYLERLAGLARDPQTDQPMGHELKLVLTGDSHHYSRYVEYDADPKVPARHYVTCGGGGAFASATHQLDDKPLCYEYPKPGETAPKGKHRRLFSIATTEQGGKALLPDAATSRRLAWRNLKFPITNIQFTLTLIGLFLVFTSILSFNATAADRGNIAAVLGAGSAWDAACAYFRLLFVSPAAPIFMTVIIAACFALADAKDKSGLRAAMGIGHGLAHFLAVSAATIAVFRMLGHWWDGGFGSAAVLAAAALASGLASSFVFGLYLIFCMNVLRRQTGHGFSALRIEGYKSFLRIRIAQNGALTLHAVGLREVPRDNGQTLKNPQLHPHLIEQVEIAS